MSLCNHHKVCPCSNLEAKFPLVAKEFDHRKNKCVALETLAPVSGKMVYWKCLKAKCGRSWQATVASRTSVGAGCPSCRQSHMEKACEGILKQHRVSFEPQQTFPN